MERGDQATCKHEREGQKEEGEYTKRSIKRTKEWKMCIGVMKKSKMQEKKYRKGERKEEKECTGVKKKKV